MDLITSKMELDLFKPQDADQVVSWAVKHSVPAIVVAPTLIEAALMWRIKRQSSVRIIAAIDWPKGDTYGDLKLRNMNSAQFMTDGLEIILTGRRTPAETFNEANAITNFIRTHISTTMEIRFVLNRFTRSDQEVVQICEAIKDIKTPTLLRIDGQTEYPIHKATVRAHVTVIQKLRQVTGMMLKASGNLNYSAAQQCFDAGANRIAVNIEQARSILKDIERTNASNESDGPEKDD